MFLSQFCFCFIRNPFWPTESMNTKQFIMRSYVTGLSQYIVRFIRYISAATRRNAMESLLLM